MSDKKFPNFEEVQKEFENFVKQRFGGSVNIFSNHINPQGEPADAEEESPKSKFDTNFNLKPKDIKEYLDRYVIKQDEAKMALAIAVCDHYNYVKNCLTGKNGALEDYSKQNVLILGPTGVGKTYLIRKIADLIGVPFVKADATRFSETGYVGANVDDLIRDLVSQASGDIEQAQYGIVYLDEADKLASAQGHVGRDVTGRGVQFGLLKLMEEAEVDLTSGNDIRSQMQALMDFGRKGKSSKVVNTGKILFIVSGAFTGLGELIKKRLNTHGIGFAKKDPNQILEDDLLRHSSTKDFIDYGFEPEFIGRLPVRVACNHLLPEDLYQILKYSKGSIINQYANAFKAYGIEIAFTDDALHHISELAYKEKTGARGLMTVCERALRAFKFELPSSPVKRFVVTKATIDEPEKALADLLNSFSRAELTHLLEDLRAYEAAFFRNHGMKIEFDETASNLIANQALTSKIVVDAVCDGLLQSYEHGLKLLHQSTGRSHFVLTAQTVRNPKEFLENLIRDSFTPDASAASSCKPETSY